MASDPSIAFPHRPLPSREEVHTSCRQVKEGLQLLMLQGNNADFSFAGIKTSLRRAIEAEAPGPPTDLNLQVCDTVAFRPQNQTTESACTVSESRVHMLVRADIV